jgi:lipoprotein-anchoring transpeptidase ErfK/SrfK
VKTLPVVLAAVLLLPACSHAGRRVTAPATTGPTAEAPVPLTTGPTVPPVANQPASSAPASTAPAPAADTLVATTRGAIPSFVVPGGPVTGTVPATWHRAPSTLPVIAQRPGWLEVRLAQRPNGSTAWVLAADVTLAITPYRIVIDLATTHLTLYRNGQALLSAPAGVGLAAYPTPTGHYFVAFLAEAPNPGYGAFVMVTSAHSDTITDWESSGDAMIAIHGPLGSDRQIATTGVAVSHGCVRLHESDLVQLRPVPVGTPIDIVAT